ncbi:MAG: rhodanese-like domain-containing protein [Polyangiaceae bacterium]|nr:rhodanese-like domain-containing protein [Myxococcales bacterium]MCB9587023.1 rhodanese-like domain-containing protein [Polyangiaceae bacterium]
MTEQRPMNAQRVGVEQALQALADGYRYLDVRSSIEFAAGHAPAAYNIPVMHAGESGFAPNPDFLRVAQATFPTDTPLLIACQAGGRSQVAVKQLTAAGYTQLLELRTGFDGCRDAFGRREPGWQRAGQAVVTGDDAERGYGALLAASPP